jgi:quinone-modifying oxidoreductase subunit QmoB
MERHIGVYLCRGCGIGDALDLDQLSGVPEDKYGIDLCRQHEALCSEAARKDILDDLEKHGLNAVLIAACSPRALTEVFQFPDNILLERVNLREQLIWCMPARNEDTQMAAEDYLRMGLQKIQKSGIPEPFLEEIDKTILVVGGGVTGMRSALDAAFAGYSVVLVEEKNKLGGWMAKQTRAFPTHPPYTELAETGVEELISAVETAEGIRILRGAQILEIAGAPGMFKAKIRVDGSEEIVRAGAIVQATGWNPYDAGKLGHLGYGRFANVLTNVEVEHMSGDGIVRPSDKRAPGSVVFVQCAGSRDPEHLPYCSSVCCMVTLKQAVYLKERNPDTEIYILYKDIRTPGQYEEFYRKVQKDGAVFIKGEVMGISENGDKLVVDSEDVLSGERLSIETDLVVLATGMVPSMAVDADFATGLGKGVGQHPEGAEGRTRLEEPSEVVEGEGMALHMAYRQGPELPKLVYGMPDSHFICFPYETRRTGIYAAGCVRKPMDARGALEDAAGAALKAIQCVEMTSRGEALHPRSGDKSYPDLFMQRCTQCKRCTEECPFGMYNEDEKANPLPNVTRCRRCAICMGSCPERIISFKDYSVDMIGSMIKSIHVPEEDEEKPRVLVFACENDAYPALDMLGRRRLSLNPYVRVIPVRCLGSLNLIWIADALSKGIDGVLLLGCSYGDDYQCHMIKGSELAEYRLGKISETLERLVLEPERVHMEQVEITDFVKLPGIVDAFLERIKEVGPNPYKGF